MLVGVVSGLCPGDPQETMRENNQAANRDESDTHDLVGRDVPDPDNLGQNCPAVVWRSIADGRRRKTLVADASIVTDGWLKTKDWRGRSVLYPPSAVEKVQKVEVERVQDDLLSVRIADDDLRQRARELWKEAVADLDDDFRQVVNVK